VSTDTTKYQNIQWIKDNTWCWGDIYKYKKSEKVFARLCYKSEGNPHDDIVFEGVGTCKEEALDDLDFKLTERVRELKENESG